jgi:O-antigen ligase
VLYGTAAALVAVGVALTFTRAAYLALAVSIVFFAIQKRSLKVILGLVLIVAAVIAFAPEAVLNRALTGLDISGVAKASAGRMDDKLTAGRVGSWELLAPDILLSPVWGRGTGSTGWTTAMTLGLYDAAHPHNMYLMAALDVGLLGLGLILYLYWRIYSSLRKLARHPDVHPRLRAFFDGVSVAFICFLIIGMTNGAWYPVPEQTYMWFAFGLLLAHWKIANPVRKRGSALAVRDRQVPGTVPSSTRA